MQMERTSSAKTKERTLAGLSNKSAHYQLYWNGSCAAPCI